MVDQEHERFEDTLAQAVLLLREQKMALTTHNLQQLDEATQNLQRICSNLEQASKRYATQIPSEFIPVRLQDQVKLVVQLAQDNQKSLLTAYQRVTQTLNLLQLTPYQSGLSQTHTPAAVTREVEA